MNLREAIRKYSRTAAAAHELEQLLDTPREMLDTQAKRVVGVLANLEGRALDAKDQEAFRHLRKARNIVAQMI